MVLVRAKHIPLCEEVFPEAYPIWMIEAQETSGCPAHLGLGSNHRAVPVEMRSPQVLARPVELYHRAR